MNIVTGLRYLRNLILPGEASSVLSAAADIIEKPGAWTQRAYARDAKGEWVRPTSSPAAVSFCLMGAVERVMGNSYGAPYRAIARGFDAVYDTGPADYNDTRGRTQEEVVAAARRVAKFI